jgi:hypothetical protein
MLKSSANLLHEDSRARLAAEQRAFLSALVQNADPPAGVDETNAAAAAQSLYLKRRNGVAQAWPALAKMAGHEFETLFREFANTTLLPAEGGPLADGRAFADFLARSKPPTDDVIREMLQTDLRFVRSARGLNHRRWPTFQIVYLPQSRRVLVGVYMPRLGTFIR